MLAMGSQESKVPQQKHQEERILPPFPTQKGAFLNRKRNQSKGGASTQPRNVKINYISVKAKEEEQAQIYAALDPSGCNH